MGNGEDILKNSADHVVAPIDQEGFAEAIGIILNQ
jgi:hydroxymethylpyrimidine pyrophosphatase-like HAD family hydrolase